MGDTKVIAFSGRAGSGKDTLCKFLQRNACEVFGWPTLSGLGVTRYAFADWPKDLMAEIFDVPRDWFDDYKENLLQLTNGQLFTAGILPSPDGLLMAEDFQTWKDQPITVRKLMQVFCHNLMRQLNPDVWANRVIKQIKTEQPAVAVITDCRYINEAEAIQKLGGKVIRLTRNHDSVDQHTSETELDSWTLFDDTIDNQYLTVQGTQGILVAILRYWKWAR